MNVEQIAKAVTAAFKQTQGDVTGYFEIMSFFTVKQGCVVAFDYEGEKCVGFVKKGEDAFLWLHQVEAFDVTLDNEELLLNYA